MQNILALVIAFSRGEALGVLTHYRPLSTLPFGGLYRFIDFAMSNLSRSNIHNVGLLFQYCSDSLIRHVNTGESWNIGRDVGKFAMLPPMQTPQKARWYASTFDALCQNLEFIQNEDPDLVLILTGDHIYHIDFQRLIDFHVKNDADATLVLAKVPAKDACRFCLAEMDDECGQQGGRITKFGNNGQHVASNWGSMDIWVFNRETLLNRLDDYIEEVQGYSFDKDIFPKLVHHSRLYGYKHKGYFGHARSIDEYWSTNMELLRNSGRIHIEDWGIRTNLQNESTCDRPPTLFGAGARVSHSLIYNGCEIKGSVESSIIFPGVRVAEGARVRNSILMYDSTVDEDATLNKAILDVEVNVGCNTRIGLDGENIPNEHLLDSLTSGITVIGRNTYIPKDMRIGKNCIIYPNLDEGDFNKRFIHSGSVVL